MVEIAAGELIPGYAFPIRKGWPTMLLLVGLMLLLTVGEMSAQYVLKKSWLVPSAVKWAYFAGGVVLYTMFGVVFRYTLPLEKFSLVTPLQHIIIAIAAVFMGRFAFGDTLSSIEIVGLVLGLSGLALLLYNHAH
jgi:drug/metabolite transporter (DMT)-like permease